MNPCWPASSRQDATSSFVIGTPRISGRVGKVICDIYVFVRKYGVRRFHVSEENVWSVIP